MRFNQKWTGIAFTLALKVSSSSSFAADNFLPVDVSGLTSGAVNSLLKTVAIGGDHRAYMPAAPLGVVVGLDIGLDVTVIRTPTEFVDAMRLVTGDPAASVPETLPLPRLNIHKGFPFGLDLGFSYISYQSTFNVYGADIKWAFIPGGVALPAVAARLSGSYNNFWFMQTHNYKLDVLVSKKFLLMEPYGGLGVSLWSGDLNLPVEVAQGFQVDVSGHQSGTNMHFFGGLSFKMLIVRITGELDYSTAGLTTYGLKASLSL